MSKFMSNHFILRCLGPVLQLRIHRHGYGPGHQL